jgi:predicted CoA-binding protein
MPLESDTDIARVLRSVKRIALLGASPRPERPSYEVLDFLLRCGYQVFPINPEIAESEILGQRVFARLADLPEAVDMVDVFRNASFLPAVVEETITCGVRVLWTQLGVVDVRAAQRAERAGVQVVMDRCPAIEWPRLKRAGLL